MPAEAGKLRAGNVEPDRRTLGDLESLGSSFGHRTMIKSKRSGNRENFSRGADTVRPHLQDLAAL